MYVEYEKWWEPKEDIPILLPKRNQPAAAASSSNKVTSSEEKKEKNECDSQPVIFLSYNWGKQKQIKHLYSRLTSMGYSCWMDIFQMGGGDSLFDKIDRGIRACRVVISCVTKDYAKSVNCRREVC